jgi:hypothetical protein
MLKLDVKPEIAAALEALASAQGLSVEDCLERLVAREFPLKVEDADHSVESGMVLGKRFICLPYRQTFALARSR